MAHVARLNFKNLLEFEKRETPEKSKLSRRPIVGAQSEYGPPMGPVRAINPSATSTRWRSASDAFLPRVRSSRTSVSLRKLSLYFGKDVPTSMWWRFKLEAVTEKKEEVAATPKYVQTYQTEPLVTFNCSAVERIIEETFNAHLNGEKYSPLTAGVLVKSLTNIIQYRVKCEKFERYRLVVQVFLGHPRDHDLVISSSFLIDRERDRFSRAVFSSPNIFAVGVVYGVYFD